MDTLAALALATDPPTQKILERPPQPKSEPLITHNMWKMIIGQVIYQLVVSLTLYFAGMHILGYNESQRLELDTIVFNTFVWMQIFNEFNNRRLDNKFNIFEGIHRNFWFQGINLIMIGGQIMIIFIGGAAFRITALNGTQWAISILCALPCLPWAVFIRCLPDRYFAVVFDATANGLAVVLRPINNVLRVIFHPVAEVFRGVARMAKRTFKKKGAKTEERQVSSIEDAEQGVGQVHNQAEPTAVSTNPTRPGPVNIPEIAVHEAR